MFIVADENIPYVKEAFKNIGEIHLLSGRKISSNILNKADILLVRSITKVNKDLLDKTSVKFVGTATIGTDHIDTEYLSKQNIAFASAPGSNANSVAEYFLSALMALSKKFQIDLSTKTVGIIGIGNVGSKVIEKAKALGMQILQNDPPLFRKTKNPYFLPLDEIFKADIITLHVPLIMEGIDKTYHLVNDLFLSKMKKGSILINTCRGKVIEEESLLNALKTKHLKGVVLDVWNNEPKINLELLNLVDIGTPHIAGYSLDGKVKGTEMLYNAVCDYFQIPKQWNPWLTLPSQNIQKITIENTLKTHFEIIQEVILKAYNILEDDQNLRKISEYSLEKQGEYFDNLRKKYPIRREFKNINIHFQNDFLRVKNILGKLEFKID
ncbi:MAG: 4-phosphoerythronate dehydrogenase [bacterium]